jgi:hypothetical protein
MFPREQIRLLVSGRSFCSYVFICLFACSGEDQLLHALRPVNTTPLIVSVSADK